MIIVNVINIIKKQDARIIKKYNWKALKLKIKNK